MFRAAVTFSNYARSIVVCVILSGPESGIDPEMYPNLHIIKAPLMMPVSTASAERSLSCLTCLKTYLRKSMRKTWSLIT